ncbi:MAG: sulfite exporter TauE/SafE family protein [Alphaproteobacteria bacterium]|nr:sulfite exporter TauE/SafE family protein [Alphaproteobacteria bacterium]
MLVGQLAFALAAGVLSSLSPCVLPILPLVFTATVSEHRWGPVASAAGLGLSFTVVGLFIATLGFAIALDAVFKVVGSVALIGFGVMLMVPSVGSRLALAGAGFSGWAGGVTSGYAAQGLAGQFVLGVLLGAVWSPCVGPTLGAASMLAAQGRDLAQVSATMLMFGVGVSLPLLGLGLLSREAMLRWRHRLDRFGEHGRVALGMIVAVTGGLILTGLDQWLESILVAASPDWLVQLTARF